MALKERFLDPEAIKEIERFAFHPAMGEMEKEAALMLLIQVFSGKITPSIMADYAYELFSKDKACFSLKNAIKLQILSEIMEIGEAAISTHQMFATQADPEPKEQSSIFDKFSGPPDKPKL